MAKRKRKAKIGGLPFNDADYRKQVRVAKRVGLSIQQLASAQRRTMADVLRDAIRDSGLTAYRIAKDAGTVPEVVTRFMDGADIRISTAGKIAGVLGLQLTRKESK